ncbi:MAG: hypothetical protein FJ276_20675, partial [Planctomycetes bacterium]|nr:hypothetical protein [Planctomycetota bacterium]
MTRPHATTAGEESPFRTNPSAISRYFFHDCERFFRYNDQITNSDYQRLNQLDALAAGRELRGLVQAGLVQQQIAHPWTYYPLTVPRELPGQRQGVSQDEQILTYAREKGSVGSAECQALLKVDYKRAWYLL